MKYSLNWIQEHISAALPDIATLTREITLRAFEVEEEVGVGRDTVFDLKVLPDRAHDALSHRGLAREVAALFALPRKERKLHEVEESEKVARVRVTVDDSALCMRYIAREISEVQVGKSPEWMVEKLTAIGARSINNIVDITNYVLFDLGQPLHAFDADKVNGGITVRLAKKGETMTTLDNKEVIFEGNELVIADDEAVLALAGIKGGKKAEVDQDTTRIILECANFNPTLTRKTSQKFNIKTDASKRYENGISSTLAYEACQLASMLFREYGGVDVAFGSVTDVYGVTEESVEVSVRTDDVNRLIGLSLSDDDIAAVLKRAGFAFQSPVADGDAFVVHVPPTRLDLRIKEDMVEEIGRQVGYEKVTATLPPLVKKGVPNRRLHYANKVRDALALGGYSEVYTYSFAKPGDGDQEVLSPVGKDRPYIRRDLSQGMLAALLSNTYYAPLIGISRVQIFEFGNVFPESGERTHLAIAIAPEGKQVAKQLDEIEKQVLALVGDAVGVSQVATLPETGVTPQGVLKWSPKIIEIDFDALIEALPEPTAYQPLTRATQTARYATLSSYPFIVRDIAIFVPQQVTPEYIETLLQREAGELLVRFSQFDKFQKEGEDRVSYGYRFVFQSFEKTLTDDEVNAVMERVTAACHKEENWQVR